MIRTRATKEGLVIPRRRLPAGEEFEIREESGRIVVVPVGSEDDDPYLDLGSNPVTLGLGDAATRHDDYLYGAGSGTRLPGQ